MYKLKKELPKEFKIKVNPEQSEVLHLHLLSIGVVSINGQDGGIGYLDMPYFYCRISFDVRQMSADCYNESRKQKFKNYRLPQIKFKDYFEKVTEKSFPEKWCMLVTEDNYKELNTWMHRNWKNYEGYADTWHVSTKPMAGDCMFYSSGYGWNAVNNTDDYTLITTEQFRAKYGDLKPKEEGYTTISDKAIKEDYEERKQLRLENEQLKRQNEQLTSKVSLYFAEIRKLNTKIDRFKEYIKEHL